MHAKNSAGHDKVHHHHGGHLLKLQVIGSRIGYFIHGGLRVSRRCSNSTPHTNQIPTLISRIFEAKLCYDDNAYHSGLSRDLTPKNQYGDCRIVFVYIQIKRRHSYKETAKTLRSRNSNCLCYVVDNFSGLDCRRRRCPSTSEMNNTAAVKP